MSEQQRPGVITIREGVSIAAKQDVPYFVGVSATTTGALGISLQRIVIPPGGAAKAHIHQGYETAIYIVQGTVETRYGPGLRESTLNQPGDFIYIAPDVPHQPRNIGSDTAIAIVARNDAHEQERVIPYDPEAE